MHPLLINEPGVKRLLLGNEAIVRGALEAGVGFVSTYPGTPSSEIGDNFYRLAKQAGVTFEYSVNEKVALEVAAGAAISGARTLCAMKHVGLNVAADPLMTLAYTGVRKGMVIISADDPGSHSSQNEQDNRYYALLSQLPMLDPATPQEAYEMIRAAFEISERFELPVILRTTTRVAHSRGVVTLGELPEPVSHGRFIKEPGRFMPVPAIAILRHPILRKQTAAIAAHLEDSTLDFEFGSGKTGIIAAGVGATYAEDLVREMNWTRRVRFLKIGVTHPLDVKRIARFLSRVSRVLVVEELEPFLENQIMSVAQRENIPVKIFGKNTGHFSPVGEFSPDIVKTALFSVLNQKITKRAAAAIPVLPPRPPMLCAGCPHRATYYLVKMCAGDEVTFASDIGCYTLGFLPPINIGDYFFCMGSSASSSGGVSAVTGKPVIGFIGDSTFFHSGMTGLVNSIHQNRNIKLVIFDNSTTGMTGHQPHPGSVVPGTHEPVLDIEKIVRGMGIANLAVVDPKNLGSALKAMRPVLEAEDPGVIISKSPCPLYDRKVLRTQTEKVAYKIDHDACKHCGRDDQCLSCGMDPNALVTLIRSRRGIENGQGNQTTAVNKMKHPPCEAACPARICVSGYVSRIAAGDLAGARELIRRRVALPNSLCRICERPCESVCIRGDYDDPIAINRLKRFAMDNETDEDRLAYAQKVMQGVALKGKKVAVVGAGPAGLSFAHDLLCRGYEVVVFDAETKAGGIARWGIPDHRLPKHALEKDLAVLAAMGATFEYEKRFGLDFDTATLKKQGFVAGFYAIGMNGSAPLKIRGEELPGVTDAITFLKSVNAKKARISGSVLVIGGGNAAMDAARSALRCGAKSVTILYRRTRALMPADPEEIQGAPAEGIRIVTLASPIAIEKAGARLRVTCRKMKLESPDESGRPHPVPIEGKDFSRLAHHVIVAIGQKADERALRAGNMKADQNGRVVITRKNGATSSRFWFAGGDAVTGPASFVRALEAGKIAAYGIDSRLSGKGVRVLQEDPGNAEVMLEEKRYAPSAVAPAPRVAPKILSAKSRIKSFAEVEATYTPEQAKKEAMRCLVCGSCGSCNHCIDNLGCPAMYKQGDQIFINPILCDGCGICAQVCPNGAIVPVH